MSQVTEWASIGEEMVQGTVLGLRPSATAEAVIRLRKHYGLKEDPYQLENFCPTLKPLAREELSSKLAALQACAAVTCRQAENAS